MFYVARKPLSGQRKGSAINIVFLLQFDDSQVLSMALILQLKTLSSKIEAKRSQLILVLHLVSSQVDGTKLAFTSALLCTVYPRFGLAFGSQPFSSKRQFFPFGEFGLR